MAEITYSLKDWREKVIGQNKNDFLRKYLFAVQFVSVPAAVKDGIGSKKDDVIYFVSKTKTPKSTTETITVPWMNSEIKIPGITKFENWSVTVRDTRHGEIYRFFHEWRDAVFHTNGKANGLKVGASDYPNNVVGTIQLNLLDPQGAVSDLSFVIYNAFVTDIEEIDLSLGDNAIVEFGVTFAYDFYLLKK